MVAAVLWILIHLNLKVSNYRCSKVLWREWQGREVSTAELARTSPFKHKTLIWQRENHLLYLLVILINSIDIYREGNGLSGRNQRSCESNVLRIFTFISMCNTVTFAWKAAGVRWRTKFDWLQQAMTHTVKINKWLAVTTAKIFTDCKWLAGEYRANLCT